MPSFFRTAPFYQITPRLFHHSGSRYMHLSDFDPANTVPRALCLGAAFVPARLYFGFLLSCSEQHVK